MIDYPLWGLDESWQQFADAQLDHIPTKDQIAQHKQEEKKNMSESEIRRQMIETGQPQADLAEAGQTWTTAEMQAEFDVVGFAAPFVVVHRKSDGSLGTLEFTHSPRVYFGFKADQVSDPAIALRNIA